MAVANVPAASAAGLQPKYQKFTSSGTFTLPTGYGVAKPLLINIQVIGGGGGGGGWTTNTTAMNTTFTVQGNRNGYFGINFNFNTDAHGSNNRDITGRPGGSGGLASTQMYLTSDLCITVGAAGSTGRKVFGNVTNNLRNINFSDNSNGSSSPWSFIGNDAANQFTYAQWNAFYPDVVNANGTASGGSGGTSSAGSVEATGGNGATVVYTVNTLNAHDSNQYAAENQYGFNRSVGSGGTPAGTAGDATPLLGTIAGGSTNNTPIRGSFGVGGKQSDANTTTGVEGTGGGASSIASSGAVIITWWE